jgi:spore germination cell wall hydrolase CwlJ-like protein
MARQIALRAAGADTPPPAVAPVEYIALPRDEARRINALVPFVGGKIAPAPAYHFAGTPQDREKAITCLASAAYYEAGNDPPGMAAVIQVVLNRVRHPAFPPTICGTIFEGSERATGCQFTYTCDGALARRPQPEVWARARKAAEAALDGFVFAPVGTATHYHTDWVVPLWGPELDKIAAVHTHLFFRFKGGWGRPASLRQPYAGNEVIDPRIAMLSRPLPLAASAPEASATEPAPALLPVAAANLKPLPPWVVDLRQNIVRLADPAAGLYVVQLDPTAYPGHYAVLALKLCREQAHCRVVGWRNPVDMPAQLPLSGNWRANLSFLYEKGGAGGEVAKWNCQQMQRNNKDQCLDKGPLSPTIQPAPL